MNDDENVTLSQVERDVMVAALNTNGGTFHPVDDRGSLPADVTDAELEAAIASLRDRGWLKLHALASGETFWAVNEDALPEMEAEDWSV